MEDRKLRFEMPSCEVPVEPTPEQGFSNSALQTLGQVILGEARGSQPVHYTIFSSTDAL